MRFFSKPGVASAVHNGEYSNEHSNEVVALTEQIYAELVSFMAEFVQLRIEDYDLATVKEKLIVPIAQYFYAAQHVRDDSNKVKTRFVKPIFVSGDPGIGKTTLLMILDQALRRLALPGTGGIRDLIATDQVRGYFPDKNPLSIAALRLFDTNTGVLSARDWTNILRQWTYNESTFREDKKALADLIQRLRGSVVLIDEAEIEGYVYFAETLAQHGILLIFTSNLGIEHIRLSADRYSVVTLTGRDHRTGDLSKVCLPAAPNPLFDLFSARDVITSGLLARARVSIREIDGTQMVYLCWDDLRQRPLMKDDFVRFFRTVHAEYVLLDGVPFFSEIKAQDIDPIFLGNLSRFVNFVDAIHDCGLPLLLRGMQSLVIDAETAGRALQTALYAYDIRTSGQDGKTAVIEWSRCLSRLRSREALNFVVRP